MVNRLAESESGLSNLPDRARVRREIANVLRRLRRNREKGRLVLIPKPSPLPLRMAIHTYTVPHEPFSVIPRLLNPVPKAPEPKPIEKPKVQVTPLDYDQIIRQCKEKSAASNKGPTQKR